MADVTGPIRSLPGSRHKVPSNATCDEHTTRPAVVRIQGDTDSFGCEMIDMCQECAEEFYSQPKYHEGYCDLCKSKAQDLRPWRDFEEGSCGPVYYVCGPCVKKANDYVKEYYD